MDRETEGREYLAQHKIPELLYSLTALLLFHRPAAVLCITVFLEVQKYKVERDQEAFGTQADIKALRNHTGHESPREFLIKTLEKVKFAKLTNVDYPNLMDESNLDAMFEMLDVAGQGYINVTQYKGALESLGLSTQDIIYEENALITLDTFKGNVMTKFAELWEAF